MRRASVVGGGVLLLALALGVLRARNDIQDEVDAAASLARAMGVLNRLANADDPSAINTLRAMQAGHPFRHLELQVLAADGTPLLVPPPGIEPIAGTSWTTASNVLMGASESPRIATWDLPRPDGSRWTVSLSASSASERHEALVSLLGMMGLLLVSVLGLLVAMRWNLARAFAPLGRLLQAIGAIEAQGTIAVQQLPRMPIRELESVAAALRHMGAALDQADAMRRRLSQQVLTLQEDERARLAREIHDEFGQRLTAMRVDAAWLLRRVAGQPELKTVVEGMAIQCELLQQDARSLLARLQPFGPPASGEAELEDLSRLLEMMQALVAGWAQPGREGGFDCGLHLAWYGASGQPQHWPGDGSIGALRLPRSLALALFRISQEALTNVARHAQANVATLSLVFTGSALPGAVVGIDWSAADDGVGLPLKSTAWQRGNGLVGIEQRAWAHGAELGTRAPNVGSARPGLRLEARFESRWADAPTPLGGSAT